MLQPPEDAPLPDPYARPEVRALPGAEVRAESRRSWLPAPRRVRGAAPTSPYATWSLVTGTAALILFLTGPVLGIIAVVLGVLATRQISRSRGELRGRIVAALGVAFGALSIVFFGGVVALYLVVVRPVRDAFTATVEPQTAEDPADFAGGATAATPNNASLTTSTVTTIGAVTVVDVAIGVVSLASELKQQHAEATAHGERLLLEITSASCVPCSGVAGAIGDPQMQVALEHVRIVRVDRDPFEDDLAELQIPSRPFPGFFLLDSDLKVKDGINGGEWGDDVAANIAPVLGPFVRGNYTNRRSPWKKLPRGTVL